MRYTHVEEAGRLEVEYAGPQLDLATMGLLHLQLQALADKVITQSLISRGVLPAERFSWRWDSEDVFQVSMFPLLPNALFVAYRPVRLRIGSISQQSPFRQELFVDVANVLADPDVRAVLTSVVGNVVYSIARSGIAAVRSKLQERKRARNRRQDLFEVGDNVRAILLGLAKNAGEHTATLRIRSIRDNEVNEVELTVQGSDAEQR